MNKKFIVLKYEEQEGVLKTVQDFANLYIDQDFTHSIEIYTDSEANFIIVFPKIDDTHFMYVVNYLRYPESKEKFASVLGYDESKMNMYFIPAEDDEYDNCYVLNRNGNCTKYSFDGSTTDVQTSQQYIKTNIIFSKLNLVKTIVGIRPKKKGILSWLFS